MTVTRKYTNTTYSNQTTYGSGSPSGGTAAYNVSSVSFTAPSGWTFSKVESDFEWTKGSGSQSFVATLYLDGRKINNNVHLAMTISTPNQNGSGTAQWDLGTQSLSTLLAGSSVSRTYTDSATVSFRLKNLKLYYSKSSTVTAGNVIQDTDFTNIGLSATEWSNISNSNFTSNSTITASAWNSKTITINM